MRLAGGTAAMVSALVNKLPQQRLHLEARVTCIAMRDNDVMLSYATGCNECDVLAKQVILALPPRLLASSMLFEPALEKRTLDLWSRTATWMAPHAKFVALYDRPFWRDAGLSGTAQSSVGPLVEIHDATTASGRAALFGFVGLNRAQRARAGEEELVGASVAQLARLFGPRAAKPRGTLSRTGQRTFSPQPRRTSMPEAIPFRTRGLGFPASGHIWRPSPAAKRATRTRVIWRGHSMPPRVLSPKHWPGSHGMGGVQE